MDGEAENEVGWANMDFLADHFDQFTERTDVLTDED